MKKTDVDVKLFHQCLCSTLFVCSLNWPPTLFSISDWSLLFFICQKWMTWYEIFRPQNTVHCDPKCVLFCKYNLRHFYERKTKLLEKHFLFQLLWYAVCVCSFMCCEFAIHEFNQVVNTSFIRLGTWATPFKLVMNWSKTGSCYFSKTTTKQQQLAYYIEMLLICSEIMAWCIFCLCVRVISRH